MIYTNTIINLGIISHCKIKACCVEYNEQVTAFTAITMLLHSKSSMKQNKPFCSQLCCPFNDLFFDTERIACYIIPTYLKLSCMIHCCFSATCFHHANQIYSDI